MVRDPRGKNKVSQTLQVESWEPDFEALNLCPVEEAEPPFLAAAVKGTRAFFREAAEWQPKQKVRSSNLAAGKSCTRFNDGTGKTYALDLRSQSRFTLLSDPKYLVWQTHFSSDGHWVTFVGIKDQRARLFVAPFRKQPIPRSDWILISDSGWDDKPHFSSNGKLVFFSSDRDGFRWLWQEERTGNIWLMETRDSGQK
jgi:Tol biopolymer transport system component